MTSIESHSDQDPSSDLDSFCGNVVSLKRHEPILRRILQTPTGCWMSLANSINCERVPVQGLFATWLAAPGNEGSCIVLFFVPSEAWFFNAVYYNRESLLSSE